MFYSLAIIQPLSCIRSPFSGVPGTQRHQNTRSIRMCKVCTLACFLQETDLPEAPAGAHAARPQAVAAGHQDEFGLPAVPQRT